MFHLRASFAALMFLAAAGYAFAGDDKTPPQWLQTAAKAQVPTYDKKVNAVVLHNEQTVNVDSSGLVTITTDYAVKVINREGRNYASADAMYLQSSSKVRDLRAWMIRPDGTTKFYGKNETLDVVSDPQDIYDEYRVKTIGAEAEADTGMVFGYESVVEERPLFTQDKFYFQYRLPTLSSRYTLQLPSGWQATSVSFNHDEIKPVVTGSSYTWELHDLGPIPYEPDALSVTNLAPRIAVNYFPSTANGHVYDSWRDVSHWYTALSSDSLTLDDTVAAKARELTANAQNDLERIKAIAAFVQSIRYISLQIDVARGGGHRPRPANLVLQRGFGDCKDKANLMRTLLKAVKIDSYLVLIYSGDPTYVKAEWASPRQFNHCIIAVKVGPEVDSPSVLNHPKLGRLMIFDATDPFTQVGDLPEMEQGSYALVAAGDDGDLVKMPMLPSDANKVERRAEIQLDSNGGLSGKITQKASGQAAAIERARLHDLSASQYRSRLEKWLTSRVAGGSLTNSSPVDRKDQNRFDLDMEFNAPTYAQIMQGRLMMFKPAMVGRLDQFTPVEGKRMTPIIIDASAYSEVIRVKLPDGFAVDEMPDPDKIETPFGKYTSTYELSNGYLVFSRSLTLNRTVVPPSGYDEVGKFFGVVRNAEVSPVVLVRK